IMEDHYLLIAGQHEKAGTSVQLKLWSLRAHALQEPPLRARTQTNARPFQAVHFLSPKDQAAVRCHKRLPQQSVESGGQVAAKPRPSQISANQAGTASPAATPAETFGDVDLESLLVLLNSLIWHQQFIIAYGSW